MTRQIFKIQVPVRTNANPPLALIYNFNRTKMIQIPVTDELMKFMKDDYKKFVFGTSNNKGEIDLDLSTTAPWQNW